MKQPNTVKLLTKTLKSAQGDAAQAVYEVLSTGAEFTATEAKEAGIKSISRVITTLREEGFPIYSNPRKSGTRKVNKYRLGSPRQSSKY